MKDLDKPKPSPFSLKSRMMRCIWQVLVTLLFRPSPRPCHRWRAWLLRLFGAKLGKDCHIYPHVKVWAPWNLVCEDAVGIGDDAVIYNQSQIYLSEGAVVSQEAFLCTGTHDYTDKTFPLVCKPIYVGPHAWVAARAFVHPGCRIGEGAIAGACAVVTKDIAPWTIVAGNPAKPIAERKVVS